MAAQTRARTRIPGQTMALALLPILLAAPAWAAEMSETVLPNGLRVVLRRVEGNPVVCSAAPPPANPTSGRRPWCVESEAAPHSGTFPGESGVVPGW
ncbi:MAG: hypothetical protein O7D35_00980 [Acidobacteria bacterium]|nr:hypothetical protein [Acidobacteriota bacterium]